MKLVYHGQHGPSVSVGNPGAVDPVYMEAGVATDVPDDIGHALIAEQPGTFSTQGSPQKAAPLAAWQSYRAGQGHDVDGLTKEQLIELADTPNKEG